MLNRWSALTLVVGLVAGYSFGTPAARAQAGAVPIDVGDRVSLRYEAIADNRTQEFMCVIGAFQGDWIRCDSTDAFRKPKSETWRSLKQVIEVTKYEK